MYRKRITFLSLMLIVGLLLATRDAAAQAGVDQDYAGLQDGALIVVIDGAEQTIPLQANRGVSSLAWSPDGTKIAYIFSDEEFGLHIGVADVMTGESFELGSSGSPEAGFPVSWTPDGDLLYAQSAFDQPTTDGSYSPNINRIAPEADAQPQTIASVPYGAGCGGGSPIPADWQYWIETGFGGSPLMLQWTDFGILFSAMCGGSGYGLLDPATGDFRYVTPVTLVNGMPAPDENISRAKLSPDGTTLVAIRTVYAEPDPVESVVLVDLATGTLTDVETSEQPEQVAWSASGDIYYAARTVSDPDLLDNLTDAQRANIEAMGTGFTVASYLVNTYRVELASGNERLMFGGNFYTIGRMVEAPDSSVWVSTVPNLEAWLEAVGDGTV
ncbi:MAG: PD40 domain-containing protein, partial [Anaerolinea sp.]|nr:PD40 domain-containing protein [Anaerolinea sp.]